MQKQKSLETYFKSIKQLLEHQNVLTPKTIYDLINDLIISYSENFVAFSFKAYFNEWGARLIHLLYLQMQNVPILIYVFHLIKYGEGNGQPS